MTEDEWMLEVRRNSNSHHIFIASVPGNDGLHNVTTYRPSSGVVRSKVKAEEAQLLRIALMAGRQQTAREINRVLSI